MTLLGATVVGIVWFGAGLAGFAYWWARDFGAIDEETIPVWLFSALLTGPTAWFWGWLIHGPDLRGGARDGRPRR